jgi:hypothetical protein
MMNMQRSRVNKSRVNNKSNSTDKIGCSKYRPEIEYSHLHEIIDNIPYFVMTILGAVILLIALKYSIWGWLVGVLFCLYGVIGTVWFIIFICPYCHFFDTRACPCGYGQIAARIRPKRDGDRFNEKFKRHIPIIFPLWVIPVIVGGVSLFFIYSNWMMFLIIVFIINSYVILPLISRQYGCAHCPQKETCPWMGSKTKSIA